MKKYLLFLACAAALSVSSCRQEDPARILLKTKSIDGSAAAAEYPVDFTVNYDWTASSSVSWAGLSRTSGQAGDISLIVSLSEPDLNERTGFIVISCRDIRDTVTLSQRQLDKLALNSHEVLLSGTGEVFDVTVGTNVPYEVEIPSGCGWLRTASATKTYGDCTVSFECDPNTLYDGRSATVVFKQVGGVLSDTLHVSQLQKDGLFAAPDVVSVESPGGEFTVELKYNVRYEISTGADWLSWEEAPASKGLETKLYLFTAAEYDGKEQPRTADVTFRSDALTATIIVTQDPVRPNYLRFRCSGPTATAPLITGEERLSGTTYWGDDTDEIYEAGRTHTYQTSGDHDITIEVYYSDRVSFGTVSSLNYVDLSGF